MWGQLSAQYSFPESLDALVGELSHLEAAVVKKRQEICNALTLARRGGDIRDTLTQMSPGERVAALHVGFASELFGIETSCIDGDFGAASDPLLDNFYICNTFFKAKLSSGHSVCKNDRPYDDVDWKVDLDDTLLECEYSCLEPLEDYTEAALASRLSDRPEIDFDGDQHGVYAHCTVRIPIWVLTRKEPIVPV